MTVGSAVAVGIVALIGALIVAGVVAAGIQSEADGVAFVEAVIARAAAIVAKADAKFLGLVRHRVATQVVIADLKIYVSVLRHGLQA